MNNCRCCFSFVQFYFGSHLSHYLQILKCGFRSMLCSPANKRLIPCCALNMKVELLMHQRKGNFKIYLQTSVMVMIFNNLKKGGPQAAHHPHSSSSSSSPELLLWAPGTTSALPGQGSRRKSTDRHGPKLSAHQP